MSNHKQLQTPRAPASRSARSGVRRGFTAVELLMVIAIAAVLAALAAPSFNPLIERWRVRDTREAMISSLYLARSEAIKRGGAGLKLQKLPLGTACPQASSAAEWSCGWVIYADANGNDTVDAGEQIQTIAAPRSLSVVARPGRERFEFDRWGGAKLNAVGFLIYPAATGSTSAATTVLCMSSGGRVRSKVGASRC